MCVILNLIINDENKTNSFILLYFFLSGGKFVGSTVKVVGRFKGLIRVVTDKDEPSLFDEKLLESLFKPKGYKIRLYVLKASHLTPMDKDIFGKNISFLLQLHLLFCVSTYDEHIIT